MYISKKWIAFFWSIVAVSWLVTLLQEVFRHKYPDHFTIVITTFLTFCLVTGWALEALNGKKKQ